MKKQNPLTELVTVNFSHVDSSAIKRYVDKLQLVYEAGLLTDEEHYTYWMKVGDASCGYSYYSKTANELLLRLAAHHTAKDPDTGNLFKFKTDWGIVDIRPILTAINWAGGVEALASVLDTVLFAYLESLDELDEDSRYTINTLKDLRTHLLRAGEGTELDVYHMNKGKQNRERLDLSHLDLKKVEHRIPVEEELEVA